ncbi:MAG: L,D-transpeptidase [Fibrobacterota bacterium]
MKFSDVVAACPVLREKETLLIIRPAGFTLEQYSRGRCIQSYAISAARAGRGEIEGSMKTPRGLHRIAEKIGAGEPAGMRFVSRKPTGEVVQECHLCPGENYILTRIIRLEGCEEHRNRGKKVDSFSRYIYIHGTNKEAWVGKKHFSHGCIVMKNRDIMTLFDSVEAGNYVYID